jgi:hypothetical protein
MNLVQGLLEKHSNYSTPGKNLVAKNSVMLLCETLFLLTLFL